MQTYTPDVSGGLPRASAPVHQALEQARVFDEKFAEGSRGLVTSADELVRYLTRWRMETAWRRFREVCHLGADPSVIFLCAGDAGEATILADLGVRDITVTDASAQAVRAALDADTRLRGFVCNALDNGIDDQSFDVVIVQDGLHHLQEPVRGFTEMLRTARKGAFFLEGSDSPAGRLLGRTWEVEGDTENYVFRWSRRLVQQVASSYLGRGTFRNESFSFWHHNVYLDRLGRRLGQPGAAARRIDRVKGIADAVLPWGGNQFCGMVVMTGNGSTAGP